MLDPSQGVEVGRARQQHHVLSGVTLQMGWSFKVWLTWSEKICRHAKSQVQTRKKNQTLNRFSILENVFRC